MLLLIAGALSSCRMDLFGKIKSGGGTKVTPLSGQWIAADGIRNSEIVIVFESSMDGATPSTLTGDILGALSTFTWSNGIRPNNTLTITPSGAWPTGDGKALNISCLTTEGAAIDLNYSFRVAGSLRYVSTLGSPGGTGERGDPIDTVNAGISSIDASGTYPGVVLVAAGTYEQAGTVASISSDTSLYGGWATDWSSRNAAGNVTILRNTRTSVEASDTIEGGVAAPFRTVAFTSGSVTRTAVFDGFTIYGAPLSTNARDGNDIASTAIRIEGNASPTITNNSITGNVNLNNPIVHSSGIDIYDMSNALISNNSINGGSNSGAIATGTEAMGFYVSGNLSVSTVPEINNNQINGGAAGECKGVVLNGANAKINGNQITATADTNATGIQITGATAVEVHGNTISNLSGGSSVRGIQVATSTVDISAGNQIINLTGQTVTGIQLDNSTNSNITSNTIEKLNGELLHGILITSSSTITIGTNSINELTGTAGTLDVCGIKVSGTTTADIAGNTITSIDGNHTSPALTFGISDSGTVSNILDNNITNLKGYQIYGICFDNGSTSTATRNTITDLNADNRVSGMYVYTNSIPVINANVIGNFTGSDLIGIQINNDQISLPVEIFNNVIYPGTGTGGGMFTRGIWIYTPKTQVNIRNNTINGGGPLTTSSANSFGIYLDTTSVASDVLNVTIENNNIFTNNGATSSTGIYEGSQYANPATVKNNNIFNCIALYSTIPDDAIPASRVDILSPDIVTVNQIKDGIDTLLYDGNIIDNIFGADFLWAEKYEYKGDFTGRTFHTAGLDVSATVTDDFDGTPRPASGPWSIGAHQYP